MSNDLAERARKFADGARKIGAYQMGALIEELLVARTPPPGVFIVRDSEGAPLYAVETMPDPGHYEPTPEQDARESLAVAQDLLRGYGHDAVADAIGKPVSRKHDSTLAQGITDRNLEIGAVEGLPLRDIVLAAVKEALSA